MAEESIFEFVEEVTLPECSRSTLRQFDALRKSYRAAAMVNGHPERLFEDSYSRVLDGWLIEDTRETSRTLALFMRAANGGNAFLASLILSDRNPATN